MLDVLSYFQPGNVHPFIIAEVSQTHDGSLGQAHAFIDAVATTGATAIKFQTHIASAESTPAEPFRVKFSRQDPTRYDYWRRMEFTPDQWQGLADHAAEKGLVFISSPFSLEAVELLESIGMPLWKVASGEVTNFRQLEAMAATGKPILLSSGLSTWEELAESVAFVQAKGNPLALFQATTAYPTPPERIGLNLIAEYQQRFPNIPVGLSDHSAEIFPSLAAYTLGARFFEVHVTLSPYMFGPDVCASLTIEQLSEMVRGLNFLATAQHHPVDKNAMANELAPLRGMFSKSVVAAVDLPAGITLSDDHLAIKKPGTGLPASELTNLLGKTLTVPLAKDDFLAWTHVK